VKEAARRAADEAKHTEVIITLNLTPAADEAKHTEVIITLNLTPAADEAKHTEVIITLPGSQSTYSIILTP
jgi:hypothetical protein